jgi:hypothetical protein
MKRRTYKALVTDHTGAHQIGTKDAYAWNSAIRATEAIVREWARAEQTIYTGAKPVVQGGPVNTPGSIYTRTWTAPNGHTLNALVWEVI